MRQLQRGFIVGVIYCVFAFFGASVQAGWESDGHITLESRVFKPDNKSDTDDWGVGLFSHLSLKGTAGPATFLLSGFGRVDRADSGRNVVSFEDFYLGLAGAGFDVRAGWQVLNWGALEFFNPADIVNSRNFDSDIENKDKFGELMVTIGHTLWEGAMISLHWMPMFQDPKLPGRRSRLSFIDSSLGGFSKPVYVERTGVIAPDKWNGEQFGARITQNIGNADLSFHTVYHMDRHQALVITDLNTYHPTYFPVLQVGGTYTHVIDKLILKAEFVYRHFKNPPLALGSTLGGYNTLSSHMWGREHHSIGAIGIEYGIGHDNNWESTLIAEGINIFGTTDSERKSLQIFQRDILLGYHLAFNDVDAKEVTLGVIFDCESVDNHEIIINAQYAQRLSDTWKVKGGVRIIDAPSQTTIATTGLQGLDRVGYVYMNLTRSF